MLFSTMDSTIQNSMLFMCKLLFTDLLCWICFYEISSLSAEAEKQSLKAVNQKRLYITVILPQKRSVMA